MSVFVSVFSCFHVCLCVVCHASNQSTTEGGGGGVRPGQVLHSATYVVEDRVLVFVTQQIANLRIAERCTVGRPDRSRAAAGPQ